MNNTQMAGGRAANTDRDSFMNHLNTRLHNPKLLESLDASPRRARERQAAKNENLRYSLDQKSIETSFGSYQTTKLGAEFVVAGKTAGSSFGHYHPKTTARSSMKTHGFRNSY